ncbi:MAG: methyl-accepting chemotaxis protein, partial [Sulfurimonas sp.]
MNLRSLFFRMRVIHWVGIILLVSNAIFLTENLYSSLVQYVVAFVIFLHDMDEKYWGVKPIEEFKNYLVQNNFTEKLQVNAKYNYEVDEMINALEYYRVQTESQALLDNKLVEEAKHVISRVQHGWYSQYIETTTTNRSLEEFKNGVNSMIKATKEHFVTMNVVLEEYAAYNYTKELKLDNIEKGGVFEILANDINKLRDAVTQMLQNSLTNGLELQTEASTLKQAVESLSTASNQQAASLEETAAAMEEMTSNVQNNVAKSNDMALMATQT